MLDAEHKGQGAGAISFIRHLGWAAGQTLPSCAPCTVLVVVGTRDL